MSEISMRGEQTHEILRGISSTSVFPGERKFYQDVADSEFGLQSQLAIRRVDSMYYGCEVESPMRAKSEIESPGVNAMRSSDSLSPSRKRWRKMGTIFKMIYFLKNPEVKRIENPVGSFLHTSKYS